jgi:hypothetical protein
MRDEKKIKDLEIKIKEVGEQKAADGGRNPHRFNTVLASLVEELVKERSK